MARKREKKSHWATDGKRPRQLTDEAKRVRDLLRTAVIDQITPTVADQIMSARITLAQGGDLDAIRYILDHAGKIQTMHDDLSAAGQEPKRIVLVSVDMTRVIPSKRSPLMLEEQ
jgi:hypothetical protein